MSALPPDSKTHDRDRMLWIFGAACLFLATLEYLVPKPLPFMRIGLANLPILLALPLLRPRELILLTILKVTGQGLIGGTLASYVFLFSAAGSFASLAVMYGLWRLFGTGAGWIGLALAGAMGSNAVQLILSVSFIFGPSAKVIIPLFLAIGFIAGLLVGFAAQVVAYSSRWYAACSSLLGYVHPAPAARYGLQLMVPVMHRKTGKIGVERKRWRLPRVELPESWRLLARCRNYTLLFIWGITMLPVVLAPGSVWLKALLATFWIIMALLAGKRLQPLYFLGMVLSITSFNLLQPEGAVLVAVAGFSVTAGALTSGLEKAFSIVALVFVSLATIHARLQIPGRFGQGVSMVLYGYERLLSGRKALVQNPEAVDPASGRGLFAKIDGMLEALDLELQSNHQAQAEVRPKKQPINARLVIFMILVLMAHYALLFLPQSN